MDKFNLIDTVARYHYNETSEKICDFTRFKPIFDDLDEVASHDVTTMHPVQYIRGFYINTDFKWVLIADFNANGLFSETSQCDDMRLHIHEDGTYLVQMSISWQILCYETFR
jgi:hypothetical protein